MLELAALTREDLLYDLGSGDGRCVLMAAQEFGARGVGIDIDPVRIQEARARADQTPVRHRVEFRHQDLFTSDFREATVVLLYLLPHLNLRLRSQLLQQLQPGTRIVSRDFDMGEWLPERVVQIPEPEASTLYLWVMPEVIPEVLLAAVSGRVG